MRHPNQAALALHAGGDLGAMARFRMERHLAACAQCRQEVSAFQSLRNSMASLAELPELPWDPMAAEMRANIRLGLSAGECVRPADSRVLPWAWPAARFGWRSAIAMAGIAALAVTGLVLERPRVKFDHEENAALQTSPDGIGNRSLRMMYRGAEGVQLSASAGGSVQARYTDPNTLYMTVSEVDAQ
jgi:anti-sigma factor RsiW